MSPGPGAAAGAGVRTIASAVVGQEEGPVVQVVDAGWLMAYAAAVGETDPRYFDTTAPRGPLAHPLFSVCYEWPLALALRARTLDTAVAPLGVHATHTLQIHRPPRAGEPLTTRARVIAVESHRAGALVVVRSETTDADGRPVTTTDHGSIYRGVAVDGEGAVAPRPPTPEPAGDVVRWTERVEIPATLAHVYSACARIWNPIHTDLAAARAAGLPGPILHGTATLALAVSRVVAHDLGDDPARVRGIAARFAAMVGLPSTLAVRGRAGDARSVAFDALTPAGAPALRDGTIWL